MPNKVEFAKTFDEAKEKYDKYRNVDPFPDISPALLNSADIADYVRLTGMIHPFHDNKDHFKPATYAFKLLGKVVYWDENGDKQTTYLREKTPFKLKRNSIVFVTLEPIIRLPYYIAARFNLKINNVYKGLLLGTGPIVDPGYCGKLSLPLHNLTNNDYYFNGGDRLIWMEFTKLSINKSAWKFEKDNEQKGEYYKYFQSHENWDVEDFLKEANSGNCISSSISILVKESKKALEETKKLISETNSTQIEFHKSLTNDNNKFKGNLEKVIYGFNIFGALSIVGLITAFIAININFKNDFKEFRENIQLDISTKADTRLSNTQNYNDSIQFIEIRKEIEEIKNQLNAH